MIKGIKQLTVAFSAILLTGCESGEQKGSESDNDQIPAEVIAAFKREYPGIDNPKWEREGKDFEAVFTVNRYEASAVFRPDGKVVETEMEIDVISLPEGVIRYVAEHTAGSRIAEASKIVNADGTVNYEAEVDSADLIFDQDGVFLREL